MNIVTGTKKINKGTLTAIAELQFPNNYVIHVFQGSLSRYDIIVRYKGVYSNYIRTPKHIHWVVDLLIKRAGNQTLTIQFINEIDKFWKACTFLPNNNLATLQTILNNAFSSINFSTYNSLNGFGEYDIEFIFALTCLLALQEKTNAHAHGQTAVMFGNILSELMKPNLDLFKVMSTAGFGGR